MKKLIVSTFVVLLLLSSFLVNVSSSKDSSVDNELMYDYPFGAQDNFNSARIEKNYQKNNYSNEMLAEKTATFEKTSLIANNQLDNIWPMHGYDNRHTGRSPYSTINTTGVEKWRFDTGAMIDGSAVIGDDGTLYFGTYNGFFYAINPDGTQKWRVVLSWCITEFGTSPAIDENGTIYVGTTNGGLHALNQDGIELWNINGEIRTSPIIGNDGMIYVASEHALLSIYTNGTIHWSYTTGHVIQSSPAIGLDGTIYFGSHDTYLYALYQNGTLKWKFKTGNWVHGAPSIAEDGTVYCGSDDGFLYALYPTNGTLKWKLSVGDMRSSPSIDKEGNLYFGVWTDEIVSVSSDGKARWSFRPGNNSGVWGSTAAISDDGTIYIGTCVDIYYDQGGELIALNSDGTVKWRKMVATDRITSSPCIGKDGTVYIGSANDMYHSGSDGYLHAFGPGDLKKIEITKPETGKRYLFGMDIGQTLLGNTIIIGGCDVEINVHSEDEVQSVDFYIDNEVRFTDTEPPFEWKINKRFSEYPIWYHILRVDVHYVGGCSWIDELPFWYIHILNNK